MTTTLTLIFATTLFTDTVTAVGAITGIIIALTGLVGAVMQLAKRSARNDTTTQVLIEAIGRVDGERDAAIERAEKAEQRLAGVESDLADLRRALRECQSACAQLRASAA